jgi:hypothetical protein
MKQHKWTTNGVFMHVVGRQYRWFGIWVKTASTNNVEMRPTKQLAENKSLSSSLQRHAFLSRWLIVLTPWDAFYAMSRKIHAIMRCLLETLKPPICEETGWFIIVASFCLNYHNNMGKHAHQWHMNHVLGNCSIGNSKIWNMHPWIAWCSGG